MDAGIAPRSHPAAVLRSFQEPSGPTTTGRHYLLADTARHCDGGQAMRSTTMTPRFIVIAVATAVAASLAACDTTPSPNRLASAQGVPMAVVQSPDCRASDENGFAGYGRYFGSTTPWSENPFLNPCWPN
jgi:hypothetical protein